MITVRTVAAATALTVAGIAFAAGLLVAAAYDTTLDWGTE